MHPQLVPLSINEIANVSLWRRDAQIKYLHEWCMKNYEAGTSTMVECWDSEDWESLFLFDAVDGVASISQRTFAEAYVFLFNVASVYNDREADAEFHRSQAC